MTHWTAKAIKEVRLEQGISQREVAARAGVASNTVMRVERGIYETSFQNIEAISMALGYELDMIKIPDEP
tara:strand:- start:176 stop:385 length:210 start_codon:yes stop_codon:yes gene_type:complete